MFVDVNIFLIATFYARLFTVRHSLASYETTSGGQLQVHVLYLLNANHGFLHPFKLLKWCLQRDELCCYVVYLLFFWDETFTFVVTYLSFGEKARY
jgi:hypothetical protein